MRKRGVSAIAAVFLLPAFLRMADSQEGRREMSGIGAKLVNRKGGVYLELVFPGGPAGKAGLRSGERILAVNGKSAIGRDLTTVVEQLVGPAGTEVRLLVEGSNAEVRAVTLRSDVGRTEQKRGSPFSESCGIQYLNSESTDRLQENPSRRPGRRDRVHCPSSDSREVSC